MDKKNNKETSTIGRKITTQKDSLGAKRVFSTLE